jgi:hypothetical protein
MSAAREFSTGIDTDEATFKKLPNTVTKALCPHRGLTHNWWTREAGLIEGVPLRQGAVNWIKPPESVTPSSRSGRGGPTLARLE